MNTLNIDINSFSYKKGYPTDDSGNGGGFAFDCRGIYNPGRIEQYKKQSGLDLPVQEFLTNETEMPNFLKLIYELVSINVDNYLSRGFENLQINFGCTGGQHRSVFAAEQTAMFLKSRYKDLNINIHHKNQLNWVK
jgi:RNase adaptor protein for sRNA GlmZ degradation